MSVEPRDGQVCRFFPRPKHIAGMAMGVCLALLLMACGGASNNPGAPANNGTQLLYATSVTGQIGTTQTTVAAFRVGADGSLTSLGTALTYGPGMTTWQQLSVQSPDATGHHVFGIESVSLLQSPFSTTYSLITFAVRPDTGALQQTSSLTLPKEPTTLVLNPAGTLMFVGLFGSPTVIATYSVDSAGRLTPVHTSIPGFQFAVYGMVINPAGNFLYVIGGGPHGDPSGVQFAIDSTGALTPVGSFTAAGAATGAGGTPGTTDAALLMTPNGRTLYSFGLESFERGLRTFAVDPVTGQLTEKVFVPCSSCLSMMMNAQGTLLFTGTFAEPIGAPNQLVVITVFSINPGTGALTPLKSFIDVAASNPSLVFVPWFVLDDSGKFLYTTAFNLSKIFGFSISDTGAVTPVPGSPFGSGSPFTRLANDTLTLVSVQQ